MTVFECDQFLTECRSASEGAHRKASTSTTSITDSSSGVQEFKGFEGPEKTLEVEFGTQTGLSAGARLIPRTTWDQILTDAGATILHHQSNAYFDSYILSESSLFVYCDKVIIKTCGTTTLLAALPKLTQAAQTLGLQSTYASFSRKDLMFPDEQLSPHRHLTEEVKYFSQFFHQPATNILGPLTSDHWVLCVAPQPETFAATAPTRSMSSLNVMMYGLTRSAAAKFCKSDKINQGPAMTNASGIRSLLPSANIHEWAFDPCGYSMNAMTDQHYATVHVTPEEICSYASFETSEPGWEDKLGHVVSVFEPSRFTVTMAVCEPSSPRVANALPTTIMSKTGQSFAQSSFHHLQASRMFITANYVLCE